MIYINLLLIFVLIVFIHELGHYTFARIFKTTVTDFSIGFGKILYSYKDKHSTNWKISLIPLGGYVKIKGLESIFNSSRKFEESKDSFKNLSLIKKIIILLSGSVFNIISAWFALFCILFFLGIINFAPIVGKVLDNSPAFFNDIKEGDIILRINEKNINYFNDIADAIKNTKRINIDILRNKNLISKEFDLLFNEDYQKYIIGISSINETTLNKHDLKLSIKQSLFFIPIYYLETFKYLTFSYKNNTLSQEIAGPIGIVKMADKLRLDELKQILLIFITISLFVGLFNLLPIPLLDGGHIVYFIIHSIFSKALPSFVTRIYLITGITIISFLFLIITYNDIFNK